MEVNYTVLAGALVWSIAVGSMASKRGRSFIGYFLLSFLVSPLISMIIVLCRADLTKQNETYTPPVSAQNLQSSASGSCQSPSAPSKPASGQTSTPAAPAAPAKPAASVPAAPARPAASAPAAPAAPKSASVSSTEVRGNIPNYVLLKGTRTPAADQTEYLFRFSTYDTDFVLDCAQAALDSARAVSAVFLHGPGGSQTNILSSLQNANMQLRRCPAISSYIHGMSVDILTSKHRLMVTLFTGSADIIVRCSKALSQADITLLLDRMIHKSLKH